MPFKGLYAFASKVCLTEFGRDFKEKISDLDWLERKVRTHDGIVRYLSSRETVVPVRFGTVFRSAEAIETFINDSSDRLNQLLDYIDGCCEMGVTIYFDKPLLLDYLKEHDDEIKLLGQKVLTSSSQGAGYMLKKKLEQILESKFKQLVEDELAELEEALTPVSKVIKGRTIESRSQ